MKLLRKASLNNGSKSGGDVPRSVEGVLAAEPGAVCFVGGCRW